MAKRPKLPTIKKRATRAPQVPKMALPKVGALGVRTAVGHATSKAATARIARIRKALGR